jgi:hypothetical protein
MAYTLQFRRDTAANWTTNNPTLLQGEIGYETDTDQLKIGNGVDDWSTLSYWGGASSSSKSTDGGAAASVYLAAQNIDGGSASG